MGRTPHDHVCGKLVFKPTIIPYKPDTFLHNGTSRATIDSTVERTLDRASTDQLSDSSTDTETEVEVVKPRIK